MTTITLPLTAVQMALDALERCTKYDQRDFDAMTALRAALEQQADPAPVPQQWQPIATAPKDGTEILAWRDDCGVMMARYTCPNEMSTVSDKDRDEMDEETLFQEDWFGGDSELSGYRLEGIEVPTHWQPLPPAPGEPVPAPSESGVDWKAGYRNSVAAHDQTLRESLELVALLREARDQLSWGRDYSAQRGDLLDAIDALLPRKDAP